MNAEYDILIILWAMLKIRQNIIFEDQQCIQYINYVISNWPMSVNENTKYVL